MIGFPLKTVVEGVTGSRLLITKPRYHRRLDEPDGGLLYATWIYEVLTEPHAPPTVDWFEGDSRDWGPRRHLTTRQHPMGTNELEASVEHWRLVACTHWLLDEGEDGEAT